MLSALALPLVTLVAGPQFTPSVPALRLVSIAIVTTVPGALLFFCLVALGKEGRAVRILATSVAGNVLLDVLLIPLLGVYGACLGALGAEWIYFGLALAEIHRELRLAAVWRPLAKLGALVLLMGLAIHLIGPSRPWTAAVAGLALFSGGCVLLRPVPKVALGALRSALTTRADRLAASEAADTDSME
jgi:O-antigen/teichoic acid export membrane protein